MDDEAVDGVTGSEGRGPCCLGGGELRRIIARGRFTTKRKEGHKRSNARISINAVV